MRTTYNVSHSLAFADADRPGPGGCKEGWEVVNKLNKVKYIPYRHLQRLTVNELLANTPCVVLVDGVAVFKISQIDSQSVNPDNEAVRQASQIINQANYYKDDRSDIARAIAEFNEANVL